jgi:acyl-CoA reductase-like NAD-dependent aldehyde dehydrogenase
MKIRNPADDTPRAVVAVDSAAAVRRKYRRARAGQAAWARLPSSGVGDSGIGLTRSTYGIQTFARPKA